MDKKSQCGRLLALLESKPEVSLREIMDLRMASHSRRISDLREQGYNIPPPRKEVVRLDDGRKQTRV